MVVMGSGVYKSRVRIHLSRTTSHCANSVARVTEKPVVVVRHRATLLLNADGVRGNDRVGNTGRSIGNVNRGAGNDRGVSDGSMEQGQGVVSTAMVGIHC